jgi:hypothetical protein
VKDATCSTKRAMFSRRERDDAQAVGMRADHRQRALTDRTST